MKLAKGLTSLLTFSTRDASSWAPGQPVAPKELLKVATRYALERQQFGRPIASFGLIQAKLAEMATRIFAAESAVYRTAAMMDAVFDTGEMIDR